MTSLATLDSVVAFEQDIRAWLRKAFDMPPGRVQQEGLEFAKRLVSTILSLATVTYAG